MLVTMAGFGGLAAIPPAAAQAAPICPSGGTGTVTCKCPTGNGQTRLCTCPAGDEVAAYCTVLPEGPPTVYKTRYRGAKRRDPTLWFHVKRGINGAPKLKKVVLRLPKGLKLRDPKKVEVSVKTRRIRRHHGKLIVVFRHPDRRARIYLTRGALRESFHLRLKVQLRVSVRLAFHLVVRDKRGHNTKLVFYKHV